MSTPDQKAFVRQAVENGRLHHEDDAVKEALSLWENASVAVWKYCWQWMKRTPLSLVAKAAP
jgi:hypothetical protein